MGGKYFFLHAAHWQHLPSEGYLTGHGQVFSDPRIGQQRRQRRQHGHPGGGAVFGDGAGRHVDVNVVVIEKILIDATETGELMAKALVYNERMDGVLRQNNWRMILGGEWGDGHKYTNRMKYWDAIDPRSRYTYEAITTSPAMTMPKPGKAQLYIGKFEDESGQRLKGGHKYVIRVEKDVPANLFWSIVVYDPQTRSELQTGQPFPSRNNRRDPLVYEQRVRERIRPAIERQFPEARITITRLSLTSGAHMGPGTWAVAFCPQMTAA